MSNAIKSLRMDGSNKESGRSKEKWGITGGAKRGVSRKNARRWADLESVVGLVGDAEKGRRVMGGAIKERKSPRRRWK